jgi:phosphatidylinositol glycan class O
MSNGEPNSEFAGIAAEFAKAKARREEEEARGLLDPSATDENKRREIQFKAIHGLLIAFFIWVL